MIDLVRVFVVAPSHVASSTIECQNFSYVYRSRKHWECKYLFIHCINLSSPKCAHEDLVLIVKKSTNQLRLSFFNLNISVCCQEQVEVPVPIYTCYCLILGPCSPELIMFLNIEYRTSLGTSILNLL